VSIQGGGEDREQREDEATLAETRDIAGRGSQIHQEAAEATRLGRRLADSARYGEAARHLEKAVALFRRLGSPEEIHALMLLSECYVNLEAHGEARAARARARQLTDKWGIPGVAEVLEELARRHELRIGLASLAPTGKNLATLLEVFDKFRAEMAGEGLDSSFLGPFQAGYLLFRGGQHAAARTLWAGALEGAPTRELEAYMQAAIAVSYLVEGEIDQALPALDRAARCLEAALDDMRVGELLAGFLGGPRQGFFHALVELLVLRNRPREAFDFAERARARAFLLSLGNHRLRPQHGAEEPLVQESEDLRTRILELESRASSDRSTAADLREVRQQYERLLVRLKVKSGEYASLTRIEPLDVQAVQEALPPDSTLISYFVCQERTHAWVVDRETFDHVSLPLAPEGLSHATRWADGPGRSARLLDPPLRRRQDLKDLEDFYGKLIAPLVSRIRHSKVVVIPHGALHYLPFAALRNPDTGKFLIEDYTLTYAPSASALRFLRAKETPFAGRVLVLGAPRRPETELGPLSGMEREAVAVARLFYDHPLLGRHATESQVYCQNGKFDLLHIAAHASYDPANPLFSRIALSADDRHDGNLEVHEILAELDLSGVNLVVLSACETALGQRSGGDEVTSLTRAFLYAGSPAVLSTLWKIQDEATTVLMEELYRLLLEGATVAEALRQAQLHLLHGPLYSDPDHWAAFSLTGDPRESWQVRESP
jgi:CHAT domain-containing protein